MNTPTESKAPSTRQQICFLLGLLRPSFRGQPWQKEWAIVKRVSPNSTWPFFITVKTESGLVLEIKVDAATHHKIAIPDKVKVRFQVSRHNSHMHKAKLIC